MKRMNRKPTSFIETLLVELHSVLWSPSGRHDKLISIDEQNVFLWSLDSSKKAVKLQSQESAGMLHYLSGGAWDPHDVNVVASTCESSIQFWDLRTMKTTSSIEAHVRNMDYDVRKKYILVSIYVCSHTKSFELLNYETKQFN